MNILGEREMAPAQKYAQKHSDSDVMDDKEWTVLNNCIHIKKSLVSLVCELYEYKEVATHTVFFGKVMNWDKNNKEAPLLYFNRDYRRINTE